MVGLIVGKTFPGVLELGAEVLIKEFARSASLCPWVGFRKKPGQLVAGLSASQTRSFSKSGAYGTPSQQFRRCKISNLLASFWSSDAVQ
jgi:hypothetical protein